MATTRPASLNKTVEPAHGRTWAVRLPMSAAAQLAQLRTTPGIELAIVADVLWLQGPVLSKELELRLRCLAGAERFEVLADRQLVPLGCLVPTADLPVGPWIQIHDWLSISRPAAGFAGQGHPRIPIQLVRAQCETINTGLLTTLAALVDYAVTAPAARLECCRFVAADDGRVFVMGNPLPALAGTQFYECQRVWIPAGWVWAPAVDAEILRDALNLDPREHLLWEAEQLVHRLQESDFVQGSRAALRTTAAAFGLAARQGVAPA